MPEYIHSLGPWKVCSASDKKCSCGQIWSIPEDHPVATVELGEWGDEYPAIRLDNSRGSMLAKAEAYMEKMVYGSISEEAGHANAHLIAAGPAMYDYIFRQAAEGDTKAKAIISDLIIKIK